MGQSLIATQNSALDLSRWKILKDLTLNCQGQKIICKGEDGLGL